MSRFYGTVQGQRGDCTRCGHSSIRAAAQSWNGSVAVILSYRDGYDEDQSGLKVRIETSDHSSTGGSCLWEGSFTDFKRILGNAR